MRCDPQVIEELRSLFIGGATPSRLIKHIVAHHTGEGKLYTLIQFYFKEAFLTPLIQVSPEMLLDDTQGLRLSFLNVNLIHQMLLTRSEWDRECSPVTVARDWIGELQVHSDEQLISESKPERIPELAKCWGALDETAHRYIQRAFGNAQALHERVQLLARLAEQLQQQVDTLQEEKSRQQEVEASQTHTPQM
jgi:hypothetical protein